MSNIANLKDLKDKVDQSGVLSRMALLIYNKSHVGQFLL